MDLFCVHNLIFLHYDFFNIKFTKMHLMFQVVAVQCVLQLLFVSLMTQKAAILPLALHWSSGVLSSAVACPCRVPVSHPPVLTAPMATTFHLGHGGHNTSCRMRWSSLSNQAQRHTFRWDGLLLSLVITCFLSVYLLTVCNFNCYCYFYFLPDTRPAGRPPDFTWRCNRPAAWWRPILFTSVSVFSSVFVATACFSTEPVWLVLGQQHQKVCRFPSWLHDRTGAGHREQGGKLAGRGILPHQSALCGPQQNSAAGITSVNWFTSAWTLQPAGKSSVFM